MTEQHDKGFFDRLGEILNTPLPGTKTPSTAPSEADDQGLLERSGSNPLHAIDRQFILANACKSKRYIE
jgi:hypothetical protein